MKTSILEILSVEKISGVSRKTGYPYEMVTAQCVIHGEKILVGKMFLHRDLGEPKPGKYSADFDLDVNREMNIIARIVHLNPISVAGVKAA